MKVNELPQSWFLAQIGNVLDVEMGQSPPSSSYNDFGKGIAFFQGKAEFNDLYPTIRKYTTSPSKIVDADSVLLSVRAPVGPTNLAPEKCCIGRGLAGISSKVIPNKFILYFFRNIERELSKQGTGTTFASISKKNVSEILFPLPPLAEQQRIVAKLDSLFARIEKLKVSTERIPQLLKDFRQAVLTQAVTGKLTEEWREGLELEDMGKLLPQIKEELNLRLKASGKKTKTSGKDLSNDLPVVPSHWTWTPLLSFSEVMGGVTKGRKLKGKETIFVPYLRVANVQDGFLDLSEIKEIEVLPTDVYKYRLEKNDILFIEGGDRDKLGRGTIWQDEIPGCIHQNHVYRARIYNENVLPKYVSYFTKGNTARKYFFENANQTVNLASINLTTLSNVPIALPPPLEQQEIVRRVESLFAKADRLEARYQNLKGNLEQLPQALLAKAFRGELVEQLPTDGDARELLAEIQKLKAETATKSKATGRGRTKKLKENDVSLAAEPRGRYGKE